MIEISEPFAYGGHLYVKAPKRVHFRSEETLEEAVSETKRHLEARTTLYLLMRDAWTVAPSAFGPMLRLSRDKEGTQLLATPDEERVRLALELAEEPKARSAAEPDRKLAEHERKLAEHERKLAEHERTLAEQRAHEEAEARVKAERERDLALAELEKLRAKAAKPRTKRR